MRLRSGRFRQIQPIPKDFTAGPLHLLKGVPTQGAAERSNAGKTQQQGEDQAHQEHLRTMGQSSSPLPADPRHSSTRGHDAVPLEPQCSYRHQHLSAVLLSGMQCRTHPCRQTQAGKLVLNHTEIASLGNLCSTSYFLRTDTPVNVCFPVPEICCFVG